MMAQECLKNASGMTSHTPQTRPTMPQEWPHDCLTTYTTCKHTATSTSPSPPLQLSSHSSSSTPPSHRWHGHCHDMKVHEASAEFSFKQLKQKAEPGQLNESPHFQHAHCQSCSRPNPSSPRESHPSCSSMPSCDSAVATSCPSSAQHPQRSGPAHRSASSQTSPKAR